MTYSAYSIISVISSIGGLENMFECFRLAMAMSWGGITV